MAGEEVEGAGKAWVAPMAAPPNGKNGHWTGVVNAGVELAAEFATAYVFMEQWWLP